LWVTHVYPRDPADLQGLFLHRLARELPHRGFDMRVVAPGAAGAAEVGYLDGIEIRRFRYEGQETKALAYTGEMHRVAMRQPLRFAHFFRAMSQAAKRQAHDFSPELIHCHWWFPAGLALRLGGASRVRYCVSLHGTDVRLLARSLLPWPLARWVIGGADRVFPVSHAIEQELTRLRLRPRISQVLPMPADDAVFTPRPLEVSSSPSFVIPARLVAQKRIDVALHALRWARDHGTVANLHVVGEGEKRDELTTLVRDLSLTGQVTFHGFVPQARLAELLGQARAVVLTSQDEGYGLVLVEAALCERPAIGVRSGAITDFVVHEETGLLVEPGDHVALGREMSRLARSPGEARRFGVRARLHALSRTAAPLADALASAYRESIDRGASSRSR
jgi:glycosyltransferase involved in cell wall biosynthesis